MNPGEISFSQTLLIVDDSASDRVACQRYLEQESNRTYQIIEAESAQAGFLQLERTSIDLILLDYRLPDLDGLSFLERLQECTGLNIPVIMLTGQGNEMIAAKAIKAGAYNYIVKQPQMGNVLRLAVRTALREATLKRQLANYQAQQTLIQDIVLRIRQSLDLQDILRRAAYEVRAFLTCDRVIVYRFLPNSTGIVEVESVGEQWPKIQGNIIKQSCFEDDWIAPYLAGKVTSLENVQTSDLASCHRQLLTQYAIQANLLVPIIVTPSAPISEPSPANPLAIEEPLAIKDKRLWGLLIAHHCQAPRQWQETEIQLLKQLSNQLAIAIQQSALYQELQLTNQKLEAKVANRTSQLQQVNDSLLRVNQALVASNQDLEQFAYIASHDLREPLRKIKSFAELLAKRYQGDLDETGDRYIRYITGGALRMQTLINDLLAYSRLGKRELVRSPTDLNQILAQTIDTLSNQIAEKNAIIHAVPLPTLPVEAVQIEQLFRNLIENALKYSGDDPPCIEIGAELNASVWTFFIQDNGIGIDPEFYERIFSIFQRLHSKSEYSGTGIGLAICQKIVERHGGEMSVTASPKQGSTFWFTLPLNGESQLSR
ncbi:MAG: ATP-binding protein [Cyanobacteria bacterium J06649_5]